LLLLRFSVVGSSSETAKVYSKKHQPFGVRFVVYRLKGYTEDAFSDPNKVDRMRGEVERNFPYFSSNNR
jgi:hypothetical protein